MKILDPPLCTIEIALTRGFQVHMVSTSQTEILRFILFVYLTLRSIQCRLAKGSAGTVFHQAPGSSVLAGHCEL